MLDKIQNEAFSWPMFRIDHVFFIYPIVSGIWSVASRAVLLKHNVLMLQPVIAQCIGVCHARNMPIQVRIHWSLKQTTCMTWPKHNQLAPNLHWSIFSLSLWLVVEGRLRIALISVCVLDSLRTPKIDSAFAREYNLLQVLYVPVMVLSSPLVSLSPLYNVQRSSRSLLFSYEEKLPAQVMCCTKARKVPNTSQINLNRLDTF